MYQMKMATSTALSHTNHHHHHKKQKVSKRVRFCDDDQITIHHDTADYTWEDVVALHYSPQEIHKIKHEIVVAFKLQQLKGVKKTTIDFCWRGLEHIQEGTCDLFAGKRKVFIQELLSLQYQLKHSQVLAQEDPIRLYAANKTKHHRKEAMKRGKHDEIEAKKVYKEDNMMIGTYNGTSISGGKKGSFVRSLVKGFIPKKEAFDIAVARSA